MPQKKWEVLSSEHVLKGNIHYNVWKDKCKLPSGHIIDAWYYRTQNDFTFICAINEEGKIVMEKSYKHGTQDISIELPSGGIELNEIPEENAKKELQEETGYTASNMELIKKLAISTADSRSYMYLYLATGLKEGKQNLEPGEDGMKVYLFTIEEIEKMIENGNIVCSQTIAALHIYINYLRRLNAKNNS